MIKTPLFYVDLYFKKDIVGRTELKFANIQLPSRKWSWRVDLRHHSAIKKLAETIRKIPFSLEIATQIHAIGGDAFFSLDLKILNLELILEQLTAIVSENLNCSELFCESFATTEASKPEDPDEKVSLKTSIRDLRSKLTNLKNLHLQVNRDEYELRAMSLTLLLTDFYLGTLIYLEFLYPTWLEAISKPLLNPSDLFEPAWELALYDLETNKDKIKDEMVEAFENLE